MSAKKFINPYNFAPLPPNVPRTRVEDTPGWKEIKIGLYTGWLEVQITTLTRLVLPSQRPGDITPEEVWVKRKGERTKENHSIFQKFITDPVTERKMIPGTSLKGPVRAILEALSDSCLSMWDGKYEYKEKVPTVDYSNKLPDILKQECCRLQAPGGGPVTQPGEGLCPCCRLFGTAGEGGGEAGNPETSGPRSLQGRVVFGDALLLKEDQGKSDTNLITLKELSSPKPRHRPFYLDNAIKIRGRKLYVHQEEHRANYEEDLTKPERKTRRNRSIAESILPGARFQGRVHFTNLTPEELGLLLWGLELDDMEVTAKDGVPQLPMGDFLAHKIGMGKPIGLGSVKARVIGLACCNNPVRRYQSFTLNPGGTSSLLTFFEGEELRAKIQDLKSRWNPDAFRNKSELKLLLQFRAVSGKDIHYPSKVPWFRDCDKVKLPSPGGELKDPCITDTALAPAYAKTVVPAKSQPKSPLPTSKPFEAKPPVEEVTPQGAMVRVEGRELVIKLPAYHGVRPGVRIKVKIIPHDTGPWKTEFKGIVKD